MSNESQGLISWYRLGGLVAKSQSKFYNRPVQLRLVILNVSFNLIKMKLIVVDSQCSFEQAVISISCP